MNTQIFNYQSKEVKQQKIYFNYTANVAVISKLRRGRGRGIDERVLAALLTILVKKSKKKRG